MRTIKVKTGLLWGRNRGSKLGEIEVADFGGTPYGEVRVDFYSTRHNKYSPANITLDRDSAIRLAEALINTVADDGCWVQGWYWVPAYELGKDEEEDA